MADQSWQSIETAPKDKEVLVYSSEWGPIIARLSGEHEEWLSRMQVPVSLAADADKLTHWQELPDPPEGADESQDRREPAPAG